MARRPDGTHDWQPFILGPRSGAYLMRLLMASVAFLALSVATV